MTASSRNQPGAGNSFDAIQNGFFGKRTGRIDGRPDDAGHGLHVDDGTFLKTQVPEGPLASSSAENDAGSTSVVR